MMKTTLVLAATLVLWLPLRVAMSQWSGRVVRVSVDQTLDALVRDEDTDDDKRITIEDHHIPGTERGDKRFWFRSASDNLYEVAGTYFLSNLLQELKLGAEAGRDSIDLQPDRIFEGPVDHISRSIKELYWDGLTRHIDEDGLAQILSDEKTTSVDGFRYLYVPHSDALAYSYFSEVAGRHADWKMKVIRLPKTITARFVRSLDGHHGLLSLALHRAQSGAFVGEPFVVPGGRFNEMYGWDSYFIVLGLLHDGRVALAKSMVENVVYEIEHYGAILNANRSYYLTRSQPPFLTSMGLAVYDALSPGDESREWLKRVLNAAITEYANVWMNNVHLTDTGLSRYFDSGFGPPPEVEPGHFDRVYAKFAREYGMGAQEFEQQYKEGTIAVPELDAYFVHDRAMRESGHDTSYRLEGRTANLVTVDLNSLLYKIETDIAHTIGTQFSGEFVTRSGGRESSAKWYARAERRVELMNKYLWDTTAKMFFDYDYVHKMRTDYVAPTTLYPLWAGLASRDQAAVLVNNILPLLEMPGGIVGSTEESRGEITPDHPERQWDYPYGWAPHQMLVWQGLLNYGYDTLAQRLAYRWLHTITSSAADYNGTVPEKFDVVRRTHQVYAEYGNVGTKFAYITREGFGWTNASYQIGLSLLSGSLREKLNRRIPPEWIYPR